MAEQNIIQALQQYGQPVQQQRGLGQAQKQQQIANLLLQGIPKTNNPLIAGLSGFFGTQAAMGAAEQFGNIEQQQMQADQERLARQEARENRKVDLSEMDLAQRERLAKQELSIKKQQMQQELELARMGRAAAGQQLTKGEEAVDRKFADEFVEWNMTGGAGDIAKSLNQLKEVRDGLKEGKISTGAETRFVPEFAESVLLPSTVAAREAVEEVVQRNLRAILGGQFSEKEGEQLIKRAYNQDLEEKENIKRLDRLIASMEAASQAKAAASQYFSDNGTLRGFQGKVPTLSEVEADFERRMSGGEKSATLPVSNGTAMREFQFEGYE